MPDFKRVLWPESVGGFIPIHRGTGGTSSIGLISRSVKAQFTVPFFPPRRFDNFIFYSDGELCSQLGLLLPVFSFDGVIDVFTIVAAISLFFFLAFFIRYRLPSVSIQN